MKNPNPLSNDWLYWDPETIHTYPDVGTRVSSRSLRLSRKGFRTQGCPHDPTHAY